MKRIVVLDMTKLFTKELLIYSLFDIRFQSPLRIMLLVYIFLLGLIWTVPIIYLFRNLINVYTMSLALVPNFILAYYMSKPIWGGKSFFDWFKCQIKYLLSPKMYFDNRAIHKDVTYKIDSEFTISRAKDFEKLIISDKRA